MEPFLALITPLTGGGGGGGGGQPPSIWPSPGRPAHPIVLPPLQPGGPPVQIWPDPGPFPTPEHPIAGPPPGIWPGGRPEHPIVLPPDNPAVPPPTVWPNPPEGIAPTPEHPIYFPNPAPPAGTLITWKVVWTPSTGWVVVGVPNVPHPVPGDVAKKK